VIGMAAAGFLGLRPILFRKPIAVEFVMVADWTPEQETGVHQAFTERGFRAGGRPIQPMFTDGRRSSSASQDLIVHRFLEHWSVESPSSSFPGPRRLELIPQFDQLGGPAARWAKRQGIRRVFIPGFVGGLSGFAADFRRQAGPEGLDCTTDRSEPQGRSLLDAFRASKADLVILTEIDATPMARQFEQAGFAGRYLIFDPNDDYSTPLPEGALVVSCFVPDLMSVTGRKPASPCASSDYPGYLMATLVLDAIDETSSSDPTEIYRQLASSPEFHPADGRSTLPGGLYVVKNGKPEFQELLK
jgi:hypothetical protein